MLPEPTKAEILAAILNPNKYWTTPTITFSIPKLGSTWPSYGSSEPESAHYGVLNATQAANFRTAVASIARVINTPIVETDDLTQPGQIRVAFSDGSGHVYNPPAGGSAATNAGDIWLRSAWSDFTFSPGWVDGAQSFESLLHDLGFALGLQHIHEGSNALPFGYMSTTRFSMMSNNTAIDQVHYSYATSAESSGYSRNLEIVGYNGPMVYDILALQALYGSNPSTAAGNTTYTWSPDKAYFETIYDAGGIDTIDLSTHMRGSIIDLRPGAYSSIDYFSAADQKAYWAALIPATAHDFEATFDSSHFAKYGYQWSNNVGIAFGTIIESVLAGSGDDSILGNDANNDLRGGAGADTLSGANGDDVLFGGVGNDKLDGGSGDDLLDGGAGDDIIDGGAGTDRVRYAGTMKDYQVVKNGDGTITVTDLRAGSPDGVDHLSNVETIVFASAPSAEEVSARILNILRQPSNSANAAFSQSLLTQWQAGQLSDDQITKAIVDAADATTSVASMSYQFFIGKVPSQGGVDFLISPAGPNINNLNSGYYQSFNLENRYINFAVNLGKVGEGNAKFTAEYGALSLFDATKKAYTAIFGGTPSDAKLHALIDTRIDYFASYGGDGQNGIGTKAAMVGWLLAEAEKADVGVMARSNAAWLTDLADGSGPFAIDILDPTKGYFKADFIFGG
ncbi:M10 family metallopeptidase C-terminal domain-containing protein [Caulobacter sp.]|uniref:M10 family metallopeptidase C-terminal domain-containing protein n=1 Tax=Caulobacter sp. TaxID=78 RepID=UPI001B11164E|nr:M10 family metallopeptidase C-terminal domain-containing protein [Caulobacter sp.]MBO9547257.1 M10 family metallopeptidase C-terminal domain-containing protein [Caulobacter sp.]